MVFSNPTPMTMSIECCQEQHPRETVAYQYDANGNRVLLIDGRGHNTSYEYDVDNQLVKVTDPLLAETEYTYDTSGQVTEVKLDNGGTFGTTYNDLNQPTAEQNIVSESEPRIAIREQSIDFGAVNQSTVSRALEIFNLGFALLDVTGIAATGGFYTDLSGVIIQPGESETITVSINQGLIEQTISGQLIVTSNDNKDPVVSIPLGAEIQQPGLTLTAQPQLAGIALSWSAYPDLNLAAEYRLYRAESPIPSFDGLTPIVTIDAVLSVTNYLDEDTDIGILKYFYGIAAYDADGDRLTQEVSIGPINRLNIGQMGPPSVVNSVDGSGVGMAWNATSEEYMVVYVKQIDASNTDIYGQRFDRDGNTVGAEFAIFDSTLNESNPDIAHNTTDNQFMIVAEVDTNGAGQTEVYRRVISADGVPVVSSAAISSSISAQTSPAIAYNSINNEYMIVFTLDNNGDGNLDQFTIILTANGSTLPVSPNFEVISAAGFDFDQHAIVHNPVNNEYALVFTVGNSAFSHIYGARIDHLGGYITNAQGGIITAIADAQLFYTDPEIIVNPDLNEYFSVFRK